MKVEAIKPHGMCAGVNAAIATALSLKNVYCLHELVHNEIVIEELKDLGFKFVDDIEEIPDGSCAVFSAHGVSPAVRRRAAEKNLKVIDTTCPFVDKVHRAAADFHRRSVPLVIIGNPDHAEVVGIAGEAPGAYIYPDVPDDLKHFGVVSQTTMNADEVAAIVEKLRCGREVETMAEVCSATRERQRAVRDFCLGHKGERQAVLVLGSATSSNSKRLAEVAAESGAKVFTAGNLRELESLNFEEVDVLGVTSGASTPERFYMQAMKYLRNTPSHIAVIMDGNGRWATKRGKPRVEGHLAGAETLGKVLEWCGERDIRYLTVYAFSTENWKRPKSEVDSLMKLFARMLKAKEKQFIKNKVRFRMIGRRGDLSASLLKTIVALERKTETYEREFIVAISYGGRAEIIDAVNAAVAAGEPVTEETFRRHLYAPDVPDPDLIIRTSGEVRTSNFLLWEGAYSEYYFTPTLWPDFSEADLDRAIEEYAGRHRRKGGL